MLENIIAAPDTDDPAEAEISSCLDLGSPRSFFLYAGAGSGKTRSLINAIQHVLEEHSRELMLRGQSIAVITYTNAAADEIARRLKYNPLVNISTIHSFAWALISPFQTDIRSQLHLRLSKSVEDLDAKSSRPGTKAEDTRLYNLDKTKKRIESLDSIVKFTYNPTGTNSERESLDHTEVIALTAAMLNSYPLLSHILTTRYPFLFVDESQDTNAELLDALLATQTRHQNTFCLGLFGDTMQRIYNDGKQNLEEALGEEWAKPTKQMNHRSAHRIVQLANSIRSDANTHSQFARPDRPTGTVRLFLVPISIDAIEAEAHVLARMAHVTQDSSWLLPAGDSSGRTDGVKKLILEHHMAARRLGFGEFFAALGELSSNRTPILEGTHPEVNAFTRDILPMIEAARSGDEYGLTAILRSRSPLLSVESLSAVSAEGGPLSAYLANINSIVSDLLSLWEDDQDPKLLAVAGIIQKSGIFTLPGAVTRALSFVEINGNAVEDDSQPWVRILKCPYSEAVNYSRYVGGKTEFETHQGVKGLEFPRVMVIISDDEARGFLFSYEKLFGAKSPTDADRRNEAQGKETSLDRTRRLFYVTCTRAETSLAVVAFTVDPDAVAEYISKQGWFTQDEVEILDAHFVS